MEFCISEMQKEAPVTISIITTQSSLFLAGTFTYIPTSSFMHTFMYLISATSAVTEYVPPPLDAQDLSSDTSENYSMHKWRNSVILSCMYMCH